MLNTDNNELSPERYDSRLFNQVYRAGLKAKEAEEREKEKKKKLLIFGISFLVLICVLFVFLFKPKPKENYISSIPISDISSSSIPIPIVLENNLLEIRDLDVTANSVLVYDLKTNHEYFSKNRDEVTSIASLTKLMTAIVLIDTYGLDSEIEIKNEVPSDMDWSIGLKKGDIIPSRDLLNGMLISSYNDIAYVVANEYEGGYEAFLTLMNEKAKLIGCNNTNFVNPMGFDSEDHYSSVSDLKKIINVALQYPSILSIVEKKGEKISWISEGEGKDEYIYTTNQLVVNDNNVRGFKTGYTPEAGQCLITLYDNLKDEKFVVIVLNSEDRFGDTEKIIEAVID
jgi:D-alanyl-D-alanine carboxypeptidase (penicillin-binding protein 5/6)